MAVKKVANEGAVAVVLLQPLWVAGREHWIFYIEGKLSSHGGLC